MINAHIYAKRRSELKEKDIMHLFTNSVHKECALSGKALVLNHVTSLKLKLLEYNVNPVGERPAKDITTGKVLNKNVVL